MRAFVILGIAYLLYAIFNDLIKRHGKKKYEQYHHHTCLVWVRSALRGKHRDHCLCYSCGLLHPDDPDSNCPVALSLYENCVIHNVVTPVYECPSFQERK